MFPFTWVRLRGNRAYVSGHIAQNQDGSIADPSARSALMSRRRRVTTQRVWLRWHTLAASRRALGDLDRVTACLAFATVGSPAPGFNETPRVTNGYSDLSRLYGPEVGMHARSSIGMMLPLNAPVNCEAEVEIDGAH